MKNLIPLVLLAAAAAVAYKKIAADRRDADLWAEATDPVD